MAITFFNVTISRSQNGVQIQIEALICIYAKSDILRLKEETAKIGYVMIYRMLKLS